MAVPRNTLFLQMLAKRCFKTVFGINFDALQNVFLEVKETDYWHRRSHFIRLFDKSSYRIVVPTAKQHTTE